MRLRQKLWWTRGMLLGLGLLAHAALLAGSDGGRASAATRPDAGGSTGPEPVLVQAAGRGSPWVNLQDGVPVEAGEGPLAAALGGSPQALAAGDLDADGVPDLVVGFGGAGGGQLVLYRGNVDAIYPHSAEARARKRAGTFSEAPFLGVVRTVALPEAPDFVAVGDFDGDGHQDIVTATRGSQALLLVPGDGRGSLRAARQLALPGAVTALGVGDVNRRDGLEDLMVGIATPTGPQLLIFEGPAGALHATPEILPMPGEVRAVAVGSVVTRGLADLVVAAGDAVVIFHGRDRKLALDADRQATVPPARQTRHAFDSQVTAVALGDFRGVNRTEIAALDSTGTVHLLGRAGASKPRAAEALFTRPGGPALAAAGGQLLRVKVSSLPQDDLLVLDPTTRQLHVLVGDPAQVQAGRVQAGAPALPLMTALETAGAPLAVLPMRLNRDALDDLVLLQTGQGAPSVLLTVPVNTFTVGNTNDSGPFSLRQAILDANASPGADAIDFQYLPSGTLEFNVLSDLPRITEALIIDGTTYEGGAIRLKTMASFLGLQLGGGSNVVRGLEFRGFPFPIVVVSAGNLVEGNKIVPPASGEFPLGFGMRIPNAVNNTIGGTVAAARNEIDGNLGLSTGTAITITGGSASGNKVQGNLIRRAAYAVVLSNAPGNLVGGTLAGARNVIIESDREGLRVIGGFAAGNLVQGNFIGLDAAGTAALGNGQNGIVVAGAPATTVGGTVAGARNLISANGHGGIWITAGASETLVQGNFIGTDVTGTLDRGNAFAGVTLSAGPGPGTVIGGNVAGARNVIAGNGQDGVQLSGATGTLIQGNFIGTNAAGTAALGNTLAGVLVDNAAATQIGGTATGAGNVIAGNLQGGVRVIGSGAAGAVLQGNRIGTNAAGTAALANGGDAVLVRDAPNALIGGTAGGAANLLSGNAGAGISLENAGAIGATVQGNRIGTNAAGTAALPNAGGGVLVIAPNALIGGTATGARNLISGNTGHGVSVNTAGAGARVQGNYIGTDVTGTLDLGNTQNGVDVATTSPVPGVVIGGTASLARNLIAGNNGHGIRLAGAGVTGAQVLGNFIGTTATGTAARPNTGHGVLVDVGASGNTIGGAAAGATNTIAFNGGDGVFVNSGIGNQLRRNAIFANAGLGIDLAPNGVTPNDPGDADAGVNNLQNFPVLTAVTSTATTTTITGSLNSAASSGFTIEFFRSLTCDGPANGEGRVFLRDVAVTTNASGTAGFNVTVTPAVPAGQTVTATATRTATRDTSEFSACRAAPLAGPSGKPPRGGGLPSILAE